MLMIPASGRLATSTVAVAGSWLLDRSTAPTSDVSRLLLAETVH